MKLLRRHDPGEGRTRRCHHHRSRSCCPTDPPGNRDPLVSMLAVAVCAVLAGACTFAAITDWVRDLDRPAWGRLGFADRAPAATTVWRLLIRIDAEALQAVLSRWLRSRAAPLVVA